MRLVMDGGAISANPPTNPAVRYLKVETEGRVIYLALGYVDPPAVEGGDPTEVWYSSQGEVLKLRNGRIVATTGLKTDWRDVRLPVLPHWSAVNDSPVSYVRTRDEMPGYRFGIEETIVLKSLGGEVAAYPALSQSSGTVRWYEETVISGTPASMSLPPSRFAVGKIDGTEHVLYAEQCLTQNQCIAWQPWTSAR